MITKIKLYENNQLKIGYHVTNSKNINNILTNGIKSKDANYFKLGIKTTIPKKVYIWNNINNAQWFQEFQEESQGEHWIILKINLQGLTLEKDPETQNMSEWSNIFNDNEEGGGYIYNGVISPNRIISNESNDNKLTKNMNLDIENNKEALTKKIVNDFSLIVYKQRNRPKQIRILNIEGYYNKRDFNKINLIYKTHLVIELTNYDVIEGELNVFDNSNENNIKIKINDKIIYNLDNKNFNNEFLIDKMFLKYENYI
jgi:hypothetical protein